MTAELHHAIHLLLTALGIQRRSEVIVPECTWIALPRPFLTSARRRCL